MNWRVPRIWEGGDVWIIGGGPSIPKQFGVPDKVINAVVSGASPPNVYSPYMESIHKKHVIGINVAYLIGDWIDMVFFGDGNFFNMHKQRLAEFPGLRVCCDPQAAKEPWIKGLARDKEHSKGISPHPDKVGWNHNSGAAAISVAVHTGAKRIILLGFDMKLDSRNMQHWHDLYGKGEIRDVRKLQKLPFERHLRGFGQIALDAKRMGVEILNCSPNSAIDTFPRYSLKELLHDNT
jgi:hypothetical protein